MKRRQVLVLAALAVLVAVAAMARQEKPNGLLLLEWARKAKLETPPVAILIEMGLKDTEPADWSGKATVQGARVVHREGYRFFPTDKLIEPSGWEAKSHRPVRVPRGQPAVARMEGIASVGVVLHLTEVKPDAGLTLELQGDEKLKALLPIKDVLTGRHVAVEGKGHVVVRLISTATPVVMDKTEDDFPAACYGPDGTLWVAYIGYHLKEESRRVEAQQLKEQPSNFKAYSTPEFGDQLFVKHFKDGKWSEPIAMTGPNEDLVRCAIAAGQDGRVIVTYSTNRDGRHDLFFRSLDSTMKLEPEQALTSKRRDDDAVSHLNPVMCTNQNGKVCVASQYWGKDGRAGLVHMNGLSVQLGAGFTGHTVDASSSMGTGSDWNIAMAAGPEGKWRVACDSYWIGDHDVLLPVGGTSHSSSGGGDMNPVAKTSRYEARPSICYDPAGRLWIAYEEGPEQWGKDYGAFEVSGNPLYNNRSIRVVCIAPDGKLMKPVAELPTSNVPTPGRFYGADAGPRYERAARYAYPKIGIDGKGRVWVTYRVKFGSRYSSHIGSYWLSYGRRLDGDKWSEPIELHHADGGLDHRPVLLPHPSGGLLVIHNTDGRYTTPESIDNQIYMSYLDLPGETAEPKVVPHEPGKKDERLVKLAEQERKDVERIRNYRVEVGGKKLQPLRGEFHRHTELSWDGGPDGSLEDMFRYGIDAAAFDWIGCGDHDNGAGREYSWWLTQKLTDAYHSRGVFTPMFTYERSVQYPHGHRNCMFAQRGIRTLPRLAEPDMEKRVGGVHADDAKMLFRYLHEMKGICAGHTAATGMGTDWRDNDPVVEPIVEIYQGDRMSYEYPGSPRAGFDPKGNDLPYQIGGWQPAGFINNAFKKGYRLGFQSSSDHWSTHISYCIILAERNDRQAILDALRKRHCYGATDNIIVDLRSGPHMQGDEFKATEPPSLQMTVIGTQPIARIDILRDSEVIDTIKPEKQEYKGTWTDPKPLAGTHYYYIRVLQTDDEIAWASPMWIDYAKQ